MIQKPETEHAVKAVVTEYGERIEAVRAELGKTEPWGNHRIETKAEYVGAGIRIRIWCPACGSWTSGTERSIAKERFVEAARRLVLLFQEYHSEDCEEARRTNLVRDVMDS